MRNMNINSTKCKYIQIKSIINYSFLRIYKRSNMVIIDFLKIRVGNVILYDGDIIWRHLNCERNDEFYENIKVI